jgi:hypothetical protein
MKKITGNIIDLWQKGSWAVVITNGCVDRKSATVLTELGAHIVRRHPYLPQTLREFMRLAGVDRPYMLPEARVFTLPVQTRWDTRPNIKVLEASARRLSQLATQQRIRGPIYIPWRGRSREEIELLEKLLDDRFILVTEAVREVRAG